MNSFFTRNVTAKVLSILFALVLWIYVMSEINPRTTKPESNIPVQLIGVEDIRKLDLVIEGSDSFTINVKLTGRRDEVYKVARGEIKAVADIRGYRVGTNNIPVEVTAPPGIEIDYSPKYIKVELEEIVKRQKEVSLDITGAPPEGYVLGEAEFKPTLVMVEGPESSVNSIERIAAKLEVLQDTVNISASLPLKAYNSRGVEVTNVDIVSPYIDVILPIYRLNAIPVKPQLEVTAQEGYEISEVTVLPQEVSLKGPDELVSPLTEVTTEAIIREDVTEDFEVTVPLILPEGVEVVGESNVRVKFTVNRITEQIYSITSENIVFTNVRRGHTVNKATLPEVIEVRLVGPEAVVQEISLGDIQLVADLRDMETGQHNAILKASIPSIEEELLKEITVNPSQVTIRVETNN